MVKWSVLEQRFIFGFFALVLSGTVYFNQYLILKRRKPSLLSPDSVETYKEIVGVESNEELLRLAEEKTRKEKFN